MTANFAALHYKGELLRSCLMDRTEPELRAELYFIISKGRFDRSIREYLIGEIIDIADEAALDRMLASFEDTGMEGL